MFSPEIVSGQQRSWRLLDKLGEGDAGEVYRVESLLEHKEAILKRPHRSAFTSDAIRQATQIETEGRVLRALAGLRVNGGSYSLSVPSLLDRSPSGTEFSERFFIVLSQAPGLDLLSLARMAHFGPQALDVPAPRLSPAEALFARRLSEAGQIPDLIVLRALAGLFDLLENIHSHRAAGDGLEAAGVLWNDVKPGHLFWDPQTAAFTVIDWGNAQLLEAGGATRDRRFSTRDDTNQLMAEMGAFLAAHAPRLQAELDWPAAEAGADERPDGLAGLRERLSARLFAELDALRDARLEEAALLASPHPALSEMNHLTAIQEMILTFGELPDWPAAEQFLLGLAGELVTAGRLAELGQASSAALGLPQAGQPRWELIDYLAGLAARTPAPEKFAPALQAALQEDWPTALWELQTAAGAGLEPAWWEEAVGRLRAMQPEIGPDAQPPRVRFSRTLLALQAAAQNSPAAPVPAPAGGQPEAIPSPPSDSSPAAEDPILELRAVLAAWTELEPDPPDSSLDYTDAERAISALSTSLPEVAAGLRQALEQPKAQVELTLSAWGMKDFETAQRGLRRLLFWDPHRRRVLHAEAALQTAPAWLETILVGPRRGDSLSDFMTAAELRGRELRSVVGPARWLDMILETFARLRRGANPADLILERPEVLNEIPWLSDYEARRPAPAPAKKVVLERATEGLPAPAILSGRREGVLGPEGELSLRESLDTWVPEARGSSARVFLGVRKEDGLELAVKILRPDRAEYGLPLFNEEVQILTLMRDVPGVVRPLEWGFLKLDPGGSLPADDRSASAADLTGRVLRLGLSDLRDFIGALGPRAADGWLPYLALEKMDHSHSLVGLCDIGYTHGRFLSIPEALRLAIQILDVIAAAHARSIVYRDHKILHFYWLEAYNAVHVIDWNVAQRRTGGLSAADKSFDLVQFAARALHHILAGRPAPGALPLGPTRPDEIDSAARQYSVQWTYDDQRLPTVLKDIIERALQGAYTEARELRDDLKRIFNRLTEPIA